MTSYDFSYVLYILAIIILPVLVAFIVFFPSFKQKDKRKNVVFIAVIFLASSAFLYAIFGGAKIVPLVLKHQEKLQELKQEIAKNSKTLIDNPENLEAWLSLAQAYSESGDYTAAARGFKQAVLLSRGHPRIIAAYAESLIMQAEGVVTQQAKKSLDIAIMIAPDLPLARYYQAIWLLQNDRTDEAMTMMKKLYHELPNDSSLKEKINAQIGRKHE